MACRVITADVLAGLAELKTASAHCVVTSPPYWALRDYGVAGQIGLEPTLGEWLARMVEVFREVRRVLRPDGTCWVNLGDSYWNGGGEKRDGGHDHVDGGRAKLDALSGAVLSPGGLRSDPARLKPKDLVGQPWRLALALQDDGWWLRSDIIWAKPNPMPESTADRPTTAHEHVFLLAPSPRYFYDADAVREPLAERGLLGRNARTVWPITPEPFRGAHFATYPTALVERCLRAGVSAWGCCEACGAPWRSIARRVPSSMNIRVRDAKKGVLELKSGGPAGRVPVPEEVAAYGPEEEGEREVLGYYPACSCAGLPRLPLMPEGEGEEVERRAAEVLDEWRRLIPHAMARGAARSLVLDPFAGAGTTLLVADRLGHDAVGVELNPEYAEMARERVRRDAPLFAEVS